MTGTIEIVKQFTLEAAHHFTHMPKEHGYRQLHGHSYVVEVAIQGQPDPETGWIVEFSDLAAAFGAIREQADHAMLNDIKGLENPSLENISQWVAGELKADFPGLAWVRVNRPSCGESCTYTL